jgi:hypothetical protein
MASYNELFSSEFDTPERGGEVPSGIYHVLLRWESKTCSYSRQVLNET